VPRYFRLEEKVYVGDSEYSIEQDGKANPVKLGVTF
jgi:hypothetical protein